MSSFGTVRLKSVWTMLEVCAPQHSRAETTHYWRIDFAGRSYASLQKGRHGERNPEIELGHVKNMVRQLMICGACATKYIPSLHMKGNDVTLEDVVATGEDGALLICERGERRFVVHPHLIRQGSNVRKKGDRGRLIVPATIAPPG